MTSLARTLINLTIYGRLKAIFERVPQAEYFDVIHTAQKTVFIYVLGARAWNRSWDRCERTILHETNFRASCSVEFRRTAPRNGSRLRLAFSRLGVFYYPGAIVDYVSHTASQVIRVP